MRNLQIAQPAWKVLHSPALIFTVAFALRLWMFFHLAPAEADRLFYRYNEPSRIAWALVSGYGFSSPWPNTPLLPTAQQPPLYPLLLAGIFKLLGPYTRAALIFAAIFNATLAAITAVLILRLGKRDFGTPAAVLAAWLWSAWTYEAAVSLRLWESGLSALLLVMALLLTVPMTESESKPLWLGFGVLAGVAALVNTTLLSIFTLFWLWAWIELRRRRASSRKLLLSIAACVVTVLPWTIRNYVTFGQFIPIRDNFGLELWLGNHEGVSNVFDTDFPALNPAEYIRLGEIQFMESKREIAFRFIGQHPLIFMRSSVRRWWKYWSEPSGSVWIFFSVLSWIGAALMIKQTDAFPYIAVGCVFPLVYYVTHTFPTYRHPIEPVILLLASYTVVRAGEALAGRKISLS